jgi:predicted metal-binding membrane protein
MPFFLQAVLKRDRQIAAGALVLAITLAWLYILAGAGMEMSALEMTRMPADMDMGNAQWTLGYAVLMFFMWWIMMAAMMLPSAAPTILLAAALNRRASAEGRLYGSAGSFAAGYLLAWAAFSLVAVVAQWRMVETEVLSSMMHVESGALAGAFLVAAALWQFTPLKQVCLTHCRSPIQFLTQRRRRGKLGALAMGAEHGVYCLGCCWLLMALLFVGGVMNLYWIIGLAALVLAEKVLPLGRRVSQLAGAVLGLWGLTLLIEAMPN